MNFDTLALIALLLAAIPCGMFLLNLLVYRPISNRKSQSTNPISVLIPARNEEKNIRATLAAVLANRGVHFEVIVLDDHSTDRTASIVAKFAVQDPRVRLECAPPLPAGWCGKQHACHVLARLARHPLLVFIDADVRLAPDALARMGGFMERDSVLDCGSPLPLSDAPQSARETFPLSISSEADSSSTKGAHHTSLGQRPRTAEPPPTRAEGPVHASGRAPDESGLQPFGSLAPTAWAVGPGWHERGPLALKWTLGLVGNRKRGLAQSMTSRTSATLVNRKSPIVNPPALASGVPRQELGTFSERLLLPLIHFVLLGFLPMRAMRRTRWPSMSAGCGQLFIARRDAYEQCGGHSMLRDSLHDGIKLPRVFRQAGFKTDLFDATDLATCRMYHTNAETWRGLGKNATEGLAAPGTIVPMTALLLGGQVLPLVLCACAPLLSTLGLALTVEVEAKAKELAVLQLLAHLRAG